MTGTKSYTALTPATQTSGTLTGFVISGTDKVFYPATATIDAQTNTVVVSSTNVPSPVAVRYGWSNTPTCNLYAKITGTNGTVVDGLPASPFRNDPVAQLNVVNGTGSASGLSPNQVVGISANSAPTNQSFAFWSGDADLLANSGGTSTTATMGRTYVSVLTNYSLNTAPTGLTGYASGLRSLLTWKALTNANSYNIKRSAFSGGPYTLIATGITTTYFVDNSTGAGTPWYYVVSANNSAGESPNSAQVAVTPSLPAAPSAFTATAGNGMAFLSWNLVPNATGYTLSRTTTSGSGYTQVSAALTGTTFVDTGLSNGTTYYYTLASQFNGATGPASAEISVAPNASGSSDPGDKTPPVITTPGNLVVDATGTNGAPVSFAATAYDAISGFANVTCSPASGSVFPIGTTTVQCSAVDATGNVATASFSITVRLTLSVWRQIHFGTSSNSGAAADNADPDGDGMTNAMEFVAGTDPMSAASCIKVSQLAPTGNDIQVSFPSVVGKTYDLQVSPTLQADSWTLVQGGITGTGSTIQVTDPNGNGQPKRFYRILVH